ncbi:50S ribosome-binding GTPase [Bacillus haikouensis]|nr:50S ribosome-binding GTPase [Bacillus haikouensis]
MVETAEVRYSDVFYGEAQKVLQTLKEFHQLSAMELEDEQLREKLGEINKEIARGVDKIQQNLNYLMRNVEWDTFNLSFFGETNAGKSTLIEALQRGDGSLIGDGSKDYTKSLTNKRLKNVNLLDMPGIEGNERKYISEIKKGVEKSHVVFYVIGTNKEPEEQTLRKIKSYLKDQAKVYSIINVRSKPNPYILKKGLTDNTIQSIEKRTKEKFREILGDHYVDNLIVHAHLGFLSAGSPLRADLKRDQEKMKTIFDSPTHAYEFSNLRSVEGLIEHLSDSSLKEIAISNTYKFFSCLEEVTGRILREKKGFDEMIKRLKKQINECLHSSRDAVKACHQNVLNLIDIKVDTMQINMQKIIYEGIDNQWGETTIKDKLHHEKARFDKEINESLDKIIKELTEDIQSNMVQLQGRMDLEFKFSGLKNSDFNISDIISKMKIGMKYVLGQILDLGTSMTGIIAAYVLNPVLGVITSVISLLKKLWEWFFGDPNKRKRQAKSMAYEEIRNLIQKLKKEARTNTERQIKNLDRSIKHTLTSVDDFMGEVEKLSFSMNDRISDLGHSKITLGKSLTSHIEETSAEFAYFDLKLAQGMIIGEAAATAESTAYRLKQLDRFPNAGVLMVNLYPDQKDGYFYLKSPDEFTYRAFSNLIDYYKKTDETFSIKGVRRIRND